MRNEEIGDTKHASWYAAGDVDPVEYGRQHGLNYVETAIVKYITRWRKPGGGWIKSLEKIIYWAERTKRETEAGLHGPNPSAPVPQVAIPHAPPS